jgi:hypothetical protein
MTRVYLWDHLRQEEPRYPVEEQNMSYRSPETDGGWWATDRRWQEPGSIDSQSYLSLEAEYGQEEPFEMRVFRLVDA